MSRLDDMIDELDGQINDMNEVMIENKKKGLTLADYDLQAETADRTKTRKIAEAEAAQAAQTAQEENIPIQTALTTKAKEAPTESESTGSLLSASDEVKPVEEKPKLPETKINGQIVQPGEETTMSASDKILSNDTYEDIGKDFELRWPKKAEMLPIRKEQILPIEKISGDVRRLAGKRENEIEYKTPIPYNPKEMKNSRMLNAYIKEYGEPEKVVQIYNWGSMTGGKPTAELYPVYSNEQLLANAPHKKDYVGDLNYLQNWSKAMKEYFDKAGIDLKEVEKMPYYKVLAAENPRPETIRPKKTITE